MDRTITDLLVRSDDGSEYNPTNYQEWSSWVSATATRNYVLGDPILDWLQLYAKDHGFNRDDDLPGYDERTDFRSFILQKGIEFEKRIVEVLSDKVEVNSVADHNIPGFRYAQDLNSAIRTFDAMESGSEVIHSGILRNPNNQTFGSPDLLVRSDILHKLFPNLLSYEEASIPAPNLSGGSYHYRVVDIKFSALTLLANGNINNSESKVAYKVQVFLYNQALGRLQGFTPSSAYILGRSTKQTIQKNTTYTNALERLGTVSLNEPYAKDKLIQDITHDAISWVRNVRRNGSKWNVFPKPSVPELYPNMTNTNDGPYQAAKKEIAQKIEELTLIWQIGLESRKRAHQKGVKKWTNPKLTPEFLEINPSKKFSTLESILDMNRGTPESLITPSKVETLRDQWDSKSLQFYVDFETVSDLDDDFIDLPSKGGKPMIFMIGCGHIEDGKWNFKCFITDKLDFSEERKIILMWLEYMEEIKIRLASNESSPLVIHWSPAEKQNFKVAMDRHMLSEDYLVNWFDFLNSVFKVEPVLVKDSFNFGLKSIAKAMYKNQMIDTVWKDGPVDGLGAMVGAWWCNNKIKNSSEALSDIELMQQIASYNEVDCKVMMEIVIYLRKNH